jgi:putative ABC transport system permease protein
MVPVQYNARSLLARKITTLATAGGMALVVFAFAGTLMFRAGVDDAIVSTGSPDNVIILRKGADFERQSGIDTEVLGLLRGPPQVSQAAGMVGELVVGIAVDHADGPGVSSVAIRGMPANGIAFRPEAHITRGRLPRPGTDEAIVGQAIAGRLAGLSVGGTVDLKHNSPLTIVGEFTTGGSIYDSEVWADVGYVAPRVGREGSVSAARVRLNSPSDFDAYRQTIETDKRFAMKALRETDYYANQAQGMAALFTAMGLGLAIMTAIAAMLGAAITMNGAIADRTREIGTLRALGFSRSSVLGCFLIEALLLALIGGAIGSIAVAALSLIHVPLLNEATGAEVVIRFHATSAVFVKALVFSSAMGLVGGLFPAIRASRLTPTEAMRSS